MGKGNDKEQLLISEIIKGNDQTVSKLIVKYYSSKLRLLVFISPLVILILSFQTIIYL